MKMHSREQVVKGKHLCDTMLDSDLTAGEQLRVLTEVYGNYLASMAKYMIREERHGDIHKCGGLSFDEEKKEEDKKEFELEGFLKDSEPPPKVE